MHDPNESEHQILNVMRTRFRKQPNVLNYAATMLHEFGFIDLLEKQELLAGAKELEADPVTCIGHLTALGVFGDTLVATNDWRENKVIIEDTMAEIAKVFGLPYYRQMPTHATLHFSYIEAPEIKTFEIIEEFGLSEVVLGKHRFYIGRTSMPTYNSDKDALGPRITTLYSEMPKTIPDSTVANSPMGFATCGPYTYLSPNQSMRKALGLPSDVSIVACRVPNLAVDKVEDSEGNVFEPIHPRDYLWANTTTMRGAFAMAYAPLNQL